MASSALPRRLGEGFGSAEGQLRHPRHALIDGSEVFIADSLNHQIVVLTNEGIWRRAFGTFGSGALGAVAVRAVRTRKDCEVEDGSSLRSDFGSSQDLCAALFAVRSQACWSASSPAFLDDPRNVGPRAVEPRAVESSSKACQRGTSPAVQPSSRLWNSRRADEPPELLY